MLTVTIDHAIPSPSHALSGSPIHLWHIHPRLPFLQVLLRLIYGFLPAYELGDTTPSRSQSQYYHVRSSYRPGLHEYDNLEFTLEQK